MADMSTGCDFYSDALADRALGRLEPGRAESVERHLETCQECRDALGVMRQVRSTPLAVPEGLEARLQAAVREAAAGGERTVAAPPTGPVAESGLRRPGRGAGAAFGVGFRRRWALPLAAAAVLAALWFGLSPDGRPSPDVEPGVGFMVAVEEYEPYGSWPASGDVIAGELVLSELSLEELELLLEEMES
jgi:anti-sigma factor RsiW